MEAITGYWKRCQDLPPLLEMMLHKQFRRRPTVRQCMEHGFFAYRIKNEYEDENIAPEVVSILSSMNRRNELQRAILADVAGRLNLAELNQINEAFNAMDVDGNGVITGDELSTALKARLSPEDLDKAVKSLVGVDGMVPYTAFMGLLIASKTTEENQLLWREFQALDHQGCGYLGQDEMAQLLKRPEVSRVLAGRGVQQLMEIMDADGDGRVCFEEFRRAFSDSGAVAPTPRMAPVPSSPAGSAADFTATVASAPPSARTSISPAFSARDMPSANASPEEPPMVPHMPIPCSIGVADGLPQLRVGQEVEWLQLPATDKWISTKIKAVNPTGAVQLECKVGFWMRREMQVKRLRLRTQV